MTLLTHVAVLSSFSTTLSPRSGGSQIFLRLFDCFDLLTHQRQARRDTWQLITAFNMILQFNYPTQYQLSIRPKIKNQWSSKHKTGIVNTIDHETARMLTFPSKVIQSSVICTDWSCVVMSRHVSCSCGTNDLNPLAQVSDPVVSCDQRSQCISRMKYFHLNLASDHQPEQPFNNFCVFNHGIKISGRKQFTSPTVPDYCSWSSVDCKHNNLLLIVIIIVDVKLNQFQENKDTSCWTEKICSCEDCIVILNNLSGGVGCCS